MYITCSITAALLIGEELIKYKDTLQLPREVLHNTVTVAAGTGVAGQCVTGPLGLGGCSPQVSLHNNIHDGGMVMNIHSLH